MSVKPIPDGYSSVTPHLVVRDVPRAIDFYKTAFGAEVRRVHYMPDGKTVMHGEIRIGNSAALFAVQKVEGDRIDAARRKSGGKLDDKGASLTRTGSGAEDQRDAGSAVRRGGIETRGHAAVRQDLDADLTGHRILGWLELGIGQRVYFTISSIYLAGAPL